MDAITWGFIGTIIGAAISIATTSIANLTTIFVSKNAKEQAREERARSFQRETLLELQIEVRKYILACSRGYRSHMKFYDLTGEWQEYTPENLDEHIFDSSSKASILIQRVSNDKLRCKLGELKISATKCYKAKDQCEAGRHYIIYLEIYEKVHEQLGKELRNLY